MVRAVCQARVTPSDDITLSRGVHPNQGGVCTESCVAVRRGEQVSVLLVSRAVVKASKEMDESWVPVLPRDFRVGLSAVSAAQDPRTWLRGGLNAEST
jgi:hypothetical protein